MGEEKRTGFRVTFDRKLKLEFHGTKVTSDAGLLAYRELDERLGLTTMSEARLTDTRRGRYALPQARAATLLSPRRRIRDPEIYTLDTLDSGVLNVGRRGL